MLVSCTSRQEQISSEKLRHPRGIKSRRRGQEMENLVGVSIQFARGVVTCGNTDNASKLRGQMILRHAFCFVSLGCLVVCLSAAQNPFPNSFVTYDLYSWPNPQGGWNFCILPVSGIEKNVELVFNEKTVLKGVVKLKHRISALPTGAEIHWFDRIPSGRGPKAEGSESLSYPPSKIVKQVKEYAEKRNIKVEILSSNPLGPATDSSTGRPRGAVSGNSP
jgi:hypothetical protein